MKATSKYDRITITLPVDLLEQIDRMRGDVSRSTYIKRHFERYGKQLDGTKITLPDGWLERFLDLQIEKWESMPEEVRINWDKEKQEHYLEMLQNILRIVENKRTVIFNDNELKWLQNELEEESGVEEKVRQLREKKNRTKDEEDELEEFERYYEHIVEHLRLLGGKLPKIFSRE